MYRYTTPSIVFTLPFEASTIEDAFITIKQGSVVVEKALSDCTAEDKKLKCALTQAETGAFAKGEILIQLRCETNDGKAYASHIAKVNVRDVLKDGVI